jgi:carbamoyl-phosphate synthase small subunit
MRVGVSSAETDPAALLERVREQPGMLGADLSAEVSTHQPYVVRAEGEHRFTVAALDLGIKRNVARRLAARGVTTHILPATSTMDDLMAVSPDAVFFSPGPGDPATADHAVGLAREVLSRRVPLFGICFGSQILGRALGFGTYKLGYGHRGINQPVLDRTTGKVEVTSHNHGFAVDAPLDRSEEGEFGRVEVSHLCLNDDVVEGLRCLDVPAFTVQYHPEAAAGPHDADYLFDRFKELIDAQA